MTKVMALGVWILFTFMFVAGLSLFTKAKRYGILESTVAFVPLPNGALQYILTVSVTVPCSSSSSWLNAPSSTRTLSDCRLHVEGPVLVFGECLL